uniref:Uncharacterized protein n=1 Tax=Oryza punctata TaxID=4537 RepID=A0A0E0JJ16_ORYPU
MVAVGNEEDKNIRNTTDNDMVPIEREMTTGGNKGKRRGIKEKRDYGEGSACSKEKMGVPRGRDGGRKAGEEGRQGQEGPWGRRARTARERWVRREGGKEEEGELSLRFQFKKKKINKSPAQILLSTIRRRRLHRSPPRRASTPRATLLLPRSSPRRLAPLRGPLPWPSAARRRAGRPRGDRARVEAGE